MVRAIFAFVLVMVMSCSLLAQTTAPQVTVWLYRPGVDNFSSSVTLYTDGRKLLNLDHGRFFGIRLSPGLHAFTWTNQPGARHVVIPVGPGLPEYFEVTFLSDSPFLSIKPLSVDTAMQAMSGLRPVDPNGVFDLGVMVPAQPLQTAVKTPDAAAPNIAKPVAVNVPVRQNAAAASWASVPQSPSSNVVKLREKTPKKDAEPKLSTKTEKETLWVKALAPQSDAVATASNPPQHHKMSLSRSFLNKVQAENGQIYTITCSAYWIVSNCSEMIDGDTFKAEVEKETMWITAHKEGAAWQDVRIKYKIVEIQ